DREGWAYFTAESYDLFYPGYGDSWPSLLGAIGMTYEQAGGGRGGLAYRRDDGAVLTLHDRAQHHRTTGQATLRTAAAGKSALLLDFAEFHRNVGREHADVLLVPGRDEGRVRALVALLSAQGIDVERATGAFRADAVAHTGFASRRDFPAGTLRVRARQPRGLLAVTLLQPEVVLDATFSYDVSAWSLPFAYGVEAHAVREEPDADWVRVQGDARIAVSASGSTAMAGTASYGWVLLPSFESWLAVSRYLRSGGRASVIDDAITIAGHEIAAGAIFLARLGADSFDVRIARAALPPSAIAVTSGRTSSGPDLGTGDAYALRAPRIALLTGTGVSATSAGAHWFFLDRTLHADYDAVLTTRIAATDLHDYDVVVAPEMSRSALDDEAFEALQAYVETGGTLVAVGNAAESIGAPIAEIEMREAPERPAATSIERALRGREARELEEFEEDVPGTIVSARLDPAHPLAFGAGTDDGRLYVLHAGGAVFEPDAAFETVAFFEDDLEKVSGVISQRNLERLAQASWLVTRSVGAGRVILFADDPLFRHFWYGTFQPFANALLIGPLL
ncbi:MAG: M14 family metallopeptidase, partial [Longimicrobiales bacterium]